MDVFPRLRDTSPRLRDALTRAYAWIGEEMANAKPRQECGAGAGQVRCGPVFSSLRKSDTHIFHVS